MDEQAKEKIKKRVRMRTGKIRKHKEKEVEKEEEFQKMTIKKVAKKECVIPGNDPENFPLLKENRTIKETFSRVCKYTVNHYYNDKDGNCISEHIFYPSEFAILEIEIMQDTDQGHPYADSYRILKEKGIGRLNYIDDELRKRNKKPERLKLQAKPERVRLQCKK
jgi:hypothetical protein